MSIKYFPNRIFKRSVPAIDSIMAKRRPQVIRGRANVASTALNQVISANDNWQVNAIKLNFNNAASRSYSVKILGGVKVITDLNDYLWFMATGTFWQKITLDPGFYTGTQLAAQLKSKLDANAAFSAIPMTFTVSYSDDTGSFTITPSAGQIKYIQTNMAKTPKEKDSIAGHLFGLTADSAFTSSLVSNSNVYGLNQESFIIDQDNDTDTELYHDDIHILSLDQALHFTTNVASTIVDYEVQFEEIM